MRPLLKESQLLIQDVPQSKHVNANGEALRSGSRPPLLSFIDRHTATAS